MMGLSSIGSTTNSFAGLGVGNSQSGGATPSGGPTASSAHSSTAPANDSRLQDVTVVKPIIIGTYSTMFSQQEITKRKSRNDFSTHRWTCLIRSPLNEDMSYFIRKIVFVLHSSFVNPHRTIYAPPYEVQEIGWGEFEIVAKMYFVDSTERPLELRHWLRLYPPGIKDFEHYIPPEGSSNCVVSETSDEIFFNDPSPTLYETLMHGPFGAAAHHPMERQFLKSYGEDEYISSIAAAEATLQQAMEGFASKSMELSLEIERLKEIYYALNQDKAVAVISKENSNCTETPLQRSSQTASNRQLPMKSEPVASSNTKPT